MSAAMTVGEIADRLGADLSGDRDVVITAVAGIHEARPGEITFVANPAYAAAAQLTDASAIIVDREWEVGCSASLIKVDDPDKAFSDLATWFVPPPPPPEPGVHPSAIVAPDASLGDGVSVGPYCVVEAGARLGDGSILQAGAFIGRDVRIGDACHLYPHVSVRERVILGNRVIVHNGTVIGCDGFGYVVEEGTRQKIPQVGTVEIGDDVEIGANVVIDRARFGVTRIGQSVKIDNLVQIGHNVRIGDHAVIVAQVGISGSVTIGERAILAGQAGVAGHKTIGDNAVVGAQAGVTKDVQPNAFVSGYPAMPHEQAGKLNAYYRRLPLMKKRIDELEEQLKALKDRVGRMS